MTTAKILAERALRILKRGNVNRDTEFDIREVMREVRDSAAYLFKGRWYQDKKDGENNVSSHYVATFEGVEVKTTGNNYCYVDIPAPFIDLPEDMGIQRVAPELENPTANRGFIPVPRNFLDIYGTLPSGFLETEWGYEVKRGRIYFTNKNNGRKTIKDAGINTVTIEQVTFDPLSVGDNDPFPAPPDMWNEIINMTVARFAPSLTMPKDVIADENPNK